MPSGRVLALSWDDPKRVPADRLPCDVCAELRAEEEPLPGIKLGSVGGGRYVVYRLVGPYEGISKAYRRLFRDWSPNSGGSMEDSPCMEICGEGQEDTSPEKLVTDLCVPMGGTAAGWTTG